jgi:Rrf2 family cysteine metabolism transcriptional repressor
MKLTTHSEYALLAMIYLARHSHKQYVPLSRIAREQMLPLKYMEHQMHKLCRAGLLLSKKGPDGGYRLAKEPREITIAQIIRLLDGPLAPTESASKYFYKPTPIEKERKALKFMKDLRDYISNTCEKTVLSDLV